MYGKERIVQVVCCVHVELDSVEYRITQVLIQSIELQYALQVHTESGQLVLGPIEII